MTWFRGKDVEVYISAENSSYGISQSGEAAAAAAWGAASLISDFIIPPLKTDAAWVGTETDATGSYPARGAAISAVEGIDLKVDAEREDVDLLGRKIQDHVRLRDTFEITITKKMSNADWAILFNDADGGLDSNNAINPADDETQPETGFRIFVRLHAGGSGEETWFTGRNCTFKNYTPGTPAVRTVTETLVFTSNLVDVGTKSYVTATTASEL